MLIGSVILVMAFIGCWLSKRGAQYNEKLATAMGLRQTVAH
jgi:hypothetical protein